MRWQRRIPRALRGVGLGLLCLAGGPATAGETDGPSTVVALVLDASGSLSEAEIARSRDLAAELLGGLPEGSEVAVFSFDDQSRLLQPRTARVDLVRKALSGIRRTGRFTALHDALYDASRYLNDAPGSRRAIVLLTDGNDENSALTLEDGLRVAQDARIPVIAVGLGRVQERVLRRIAKLTGGDYLAGEGLGGATLAASVQSAPSASGAAASPARAAAASRPAAARVPAAAPAVATRPARDTSGRSRTLFGVWLLLLLVAAAAGVVFVLRHRARPPADSLPAADSTLRTDLSATVLARLENTEEYLEKTVTLRERPVLTITRGPGAGGLFELSQATAVSIGRARVNDIVLEDVSISGQHCRIRPEQGGFVLHDLKSTNGTFVNEKRVSRHTLADGDSVQIGETVMQFRNEYRRA
jgi:hypothetical protein